MGEWEGSHNTVDIIKCYDNVGFIDVFANCARMCVCILVCLCYSTLIAKLTIQFHNHPLQINNLLNWTIYFSVKYNICAKKNLGSVSRNIFSYAHRNQP